MIRLELQIELAYTVGEPGADFFFLIHAAKTAQQQVIAETLDISAPQAEWDVEEDPCFQQRCLRLHAPAGPLTVRYAATVDIAHHQVAPEQIAEVPVRRLPMAVMQYVYPSRYCPSDSMSELAMREFGHLPQGYARAQAICDWVRGHVRFCSNTSTSTTNALDTLRDGVGVCRDFTHLMIALCRACNLPARFVTGTDYGADPALGPPDFHAYVEVYLGGRWFLFDPAGVAIPMGMLRIATGRDAADVAFATIFGAVRSAQPVISTLALEDEGHDWRLPQHSAMALSTAR